MHVQSPLFITLIASSSIFILTGLIMINYPPKKINSIYGYRTENSMKNQERWDFAQYYSAKQMVLIGIMLLITSLPGLVFEINDLVGTMLGLLILALTTIVLFKRTEKALKTKFD